MKLPEDDFEIGVICPRCAFEAAKSIAWIRRHIELECARCGTIIVLESANFRRSRK